MSPQLCIACGLHPQHWRGLCASCAQWLGVGWRRRITEGGESERRRAVEAVRTHLASLNKFRTKAAI